MSTKNEEDFYLLRPTNDCTVAKKFKDEFRSNHGQVELSLKTTQGLYYETIGSQQDLSYIRVDNTSHGSETFGFALVSRKFYFFNKEDMSGHSIFVPSISSKCNFLDAGDTVFENLYISSEARKIFENSSFTGVELEKVTDLHPYDGYGELAKNYGPRFQGN